MKKWFGPLIMITYAALIVGMVYGIFVNPEYEDLGWICMIVANMITCASFIRDARDKMRQENIISAKIWFIIYCLLEAVFAAGLVIWIVLMF